MDGLDELIDYDYRGNKKGTLLFFLPLFRFFYTHISINKYEKAKEYC